jgi:hypothetical protein
MKTTSDNLLFSLAVAISLWVVFASGYLCYVNHDDGRPYVAIALIFAMWAIRHFLHGDAETDPKSIAKQRKLTLSIVFSGLLLSLAISARLGWLDGLGEFGERTRGVFAGAFVVILSNAIPKQVSSARCVAMLRVAGWALVLGGLGYAMAWLLLPVVYANEAAVLVLLFALTYATVRILWLMRRNRPAPPTQSG